MPDDNRVNPDQRVERWTLVRGRKDDGSWRPWELVQPGTPPPRYRNMEGRQAISLSAVPELRARLERIEKLSERFPFLANANDHLATILREVREILSRFPVPDEKEETDGD